MKRRKLLIYLLAFLLIILVILWRNKSAEAPNETLNGSGGQVVLFDKNRYSIDDPSSIWVIVNKKRPLNPIAFIPPDLVTPQIPLSDSPADNVMKIRQEAATALEQMSSAGQNEGVNLLLVSGYRSYDSQKSIYSSEVWGFGQAAADLQSARPGYSEHQTGLAVDLGSTSRKCEIQDCYANTAEGKWLVAHAYQYGFIVRYLPEKTAVTGYRYEPWHVRYVGKLLSEEMHRRGVTTLEEFFGQPAAANY